MASVTHLLLLANCIAIILGDIAGYASRAAAVKRVCRRDSYRLSAVRRFPPNGGPAAELSGVERLNQLNMPRLLAGARMLEIGGPTADVDLYTLVASADNVVLRNHFAIFQQRVDHEDPERNELGRVFDGAPYVVGDDGPAGPRRTMGIMYQRHGAHLDGIANKSYDIVFASHTLEHFIDPLAALLEWDRVLKPGGLLMLILPHAPVTFDKFVAPSNMQELLHLHYADAGNDDQLLRERLDARLRLVPWDYDFGSTWPDVSENASAEDRHRTFWKSIVSLCREGAANSKPGPVGEIKCDNPEVDETLWHWHVWDFDLLHEVVEDCLAYRVLWAHLHIPYHQVVLAQKPTTHVF